MHNPQERFACLIPKPTSFFLSEGNFVLSPNTIIVVQAENSETAFISYILSKSLGEVSGYEIAVMAHGNNQERGNIHLSLDTDDSLGEEGYELSVTTDSVRLNANSPAGLFYGVQTLRQLLPVHSSDAVSLPALSIRDIPR
ncbi:MAG TPA: glycoside hydrolase family 20 zincin-like fold domain-containing protein, partial [Anaerolineales bacterium]|nr:glycoside hydrolase family 20 zincin-like fold domain-containing protein [Anaerolineales bacterium]